MSRCKRSAPSKDRTCDLGFRKALLYPTELRGRAAEAVTSPRDAQASPKRKRSPSGIFALAWTKH